MARRLHTWIEGVTDLFQGIVSNPWWAVSIAIWTVVWMAYQQWWAKHPVEGAFNSWAYTVLLYTVASLWIENLMKVSQAHQSRIQQQQMNRIEFMQREQKKNNENMRLLLEEMENRDRLMHNVISVQNKLALELYEILKSKEQE